MNKSNAKTDYIFMHVQTYIGICVRAWDVKFKVMSDKLTYQPTDRQTNRRTHEGKLHIQQAQKTRRCGKSEGKIEEK